MVYVDSHRILKWRVPGDYTFERIAHKIRRLMADRAIRLLSVFTVDLENTTVRRKLIQASERSYFKRRHCRFYSQPNNYWDLNLPEEIDSDYYVNFLALCPPDNTNTILGIQSNQDDRKHTKRAKATPQEKLELTAAELDARYPGEQGGDYIFYTTGFTVSSPRDIGVTIDLGKYVDPPDHKLVREAYWNEHEYVYGTKYHRTQDGELMIEFAPPRPFKKTPFHFDDFYREFVPNEGGKRGRSMPARSARYYRSINPVYRKNKPRYNTEIHEDELIAAADNAKRLRDEENKLLLKIEQEEAKKAIRAMQQGDKNAEADV